MRMSTSMLSALSVSAILDQQSALSKTQNEISTGKRVNTPADDPVAATQIAQLTNTQSQNTQYVSNGQSATTRLNFETQALTNSTSTLQSIRDLVVSANNAGNNASDIKAIATQIQSLESQLQGVANSQDSQGEYLFAGYSAGTQPFVRGSTGSVNYLGDTGARSVQLDSTTSVQQGDAGSSVYMNIMSGNGTFTTAATAGNSGTGVIDTGSVTNPAAWVSGQYTVTFTDATHWAVTDSGGAPVTDGSGTPVAGTYDPIQGGAVAFDGIQVGISGAPAAGDKFTVSPSGTESVFATLDKLVTTLNNAGASPAARAQLSTALGGSLQQIDQAMNQVSKVNSQVGARINLVTSLSTSLSAQKLSLTTQISGLADVDIVSATAQLSQQYIGLQAAEDSYAQIAQLSLFKYLS